MATPQGYVFDEASTSRIVQAVRTIEGDVPDRSAGASSREPRAFGRLAKIESNAGGAGYYKGRLLYRRPTAINVGQALSADVLGQPSGREIYLANLAEIGRGTHALTNSSNTLDRYFEVRPFGVATDGKPVYRIYGLWLKACSQ